MRRRTGKIGIASKNLQHRDSRLLIHAEETIRSFFREQFNEAPRLLKLEFKEDTIHVHGYRTFAPAEVKAMAVGLSSKRMQRYQQALVLNAKKTLKETLRIALGQNVVDVEWFLDALQHEFDIVITLDNTINQAAEHSFARHKNTLQPISQ